MKQETEPCGCEITTYDDGTIDQLVCAEHNMAIINHLMQPIKCPCGCDDMSLLDLYPKGGKTLVYCNQCGKSHVQTHTSVPEKSTR